MCLDADPKPCDLSNDSKILPSSRTHSSVVCLTSIDLSTKLSRESVDLRKGPFFSTLLVGIVSSQDMLVVLGGLLHEKQLSATASGPAA